MIWSQTWPWSEAKSGSSSRSERVTERFLDLRIWEAMKWRDCKEVVLEGLDERDVIRQWRVAGEDGDEGEAVAVLGRAEGDGFEK